MDNGRKSDTKKILLAVLGVAILIVSVVGVSFAVFSITRESDENSIKTGTITVSYIETNTTINVEDALPTSDDAAKDGGDYFEFTVSTKADGIDIPYEINLQPANDTVEDSIEPLKDSHIKVYLTKVVDGEEEAVGNQEILGSLTKSKVTGRENCYVIHSATDKHTESDTVTTTYHLRMWVADSVVFTLSGSGADGAFTDNEVDSSKKHTYKLKVNVDSTVKPIGTKE